MRICLVYDLLYPHTVGGAERWYRNLAVRLAEEGHEVTYLTMRVWDVAEEPDVPGVRVVAVGVGQPAPGTPPAGVDDESAVPDRRSAL